MRPDDAPGRSVVERVSEAIATAGVGREDLFADLVDLEAVAVEVTDATTELTVALPVPAVDIRERLAADLRRVVDDVDGVHGVEITWRPTVMDPGVQVDLLPEVSHVVAIASGKGGVGKSTIAANVAAALADAGAAVGLLDADVYGPNAPAYLGAADGPPATTHAGKIVPVEVGGVRVMSMDFIVDDADPIIWRGPVVDDLIHQLTGDVDWGPLDYLVVDLPPGTGDAHLTMIQHLPVSGVAIVTTPAEAARADSERSLRSFARYDVPVLGVVENMSWFRCDECESEHAIFGANAGADLASAFEIPLLARLPLDRAVTETVDADPGGLSIPLVGRVGLPRHRHEREPRYTPVAVREDGEARAAMRTLATRLAARVRHATLVLRDDSAS